jgi:2-haloacid dehalogenase
VAQAAILGQEKFLGNAAKVERLHWRAAAGSGRSHRRGNGVRRMPELKPKYITFDCYGTLTRFRMSEMARERFADRIGPGRMEAFVEDFKAYRLDEVLGAWKPYVEVIKNAIQRTCKLWDIRYDDREAQEFYDAIPDWGPHPDVRQPLARIAEHFPLVILSNTSDDQIHANVAKLGAPFHAVFTAQQAQAYKPRLRAFEYMFDRLRCGPADVLHVSASLRYDLMSANDLRIKDKVFVNRGYEPPIPSYGYFEIGDLSGLPGLLGL